MAAQPQRDSSPDRLSSLPTRGGGNKVVAILLLGGLAVLGIAAYLLLRDKGSEPEPEPGPAAQQVFEAPKPMINEVPRPILDRAPDAGTLVVVPDEQEKKPRGGGGERLGTIDAAAVNAYVKEHFSEVRACYERRLKMNPLLEGDLDLNISIASTGKVTGIGVNNDTVRDADMLDCVRRTIRGWSFPKPTGGRAVVAKNFKFKKKG